MNGWPLDEHVWQIGMKDILSRIGVISLNMEWIYPKLRLRSWLYKVHFDSTNLLHRIRFCMNERTRKLIVSAPYSIQHSRHSQRDTRNPDCEPPSCGSQTFECGGNSVNVIAGCSDGCGLRNKIHYLFAAFVPPTPRNQSRGSCVCLIRWCSTVRQCCDREGFILQAVSFFFICSTSLQFKICNTPLFVIGSDVLQTWRLHNPFTQAPFRFQTFCRWSSKGHGTKVLLLYAEAKKCFQRREGFRVSWYMQILSSWVSWRIDSASTRQHTFLVQEVYRICWREWSFYDKMCLLTRCTWKKKISVLEVKY